MILLLDNFDSFTYNLVDYFNQLQVKSQVFRNNAPLSEIIKHNYKGVVLSPGPEVPEKAGNLLQVLEYYHDKLPVLGICLGHQAIGQFFGSKIIKGKRPMHGKISKVHLKHDPLFEGIPDQINVVRYNSLVVEDHSVANQVIAYSGENEVMAIKNNFFPIWGIQFHPEAALTEYGLQMLKNWLTYNHIAV
ncbi:anthranilate synthase component II [Fulvivirga imtechensis AK7]|uniref:Anthranilate synthase component II n=1 Tax=Fulvivirga imtechensis AK7 TaxID=1237149 RepID=L8JT54_9BACT|nr:aminodeoxychorismate/anthranilate synthase component II [Fulvivirga imtechensis]ELR71388.1 anthranilate synthase component II [Fulvivirga imtechensis AK7]